MSTASVALPAPLRSEPVLEAFRALAPVRGEDRGSDASARADTTTSSPSAAHSAAHGAAHGAATSPVLLTRPVTWAKPQDDLWLLSVKNYGLALATFGVYHFWGRAEMNRQMINSIHVNGKPLDYTGSGREAFVSFVMGTVICATIVSIFVYMFLLGPGGGTNNPTIEGIREFRWQRLTISLPLLFLLGSIAYRKRHHILRRSWVGGERFHLTGFAWGYAWTHFWTAFLVPATLGWAAPWRSSRLAARKIDEMQHDSGMRFKAAPELGALYRTFAAIWIGGGLLYVATMIALARYIGPELITAINGLTIQPLLSWHVLTGAATVLSVAILPLLAFAFAWRKAWLEHQISAIAFDGGRLRLRMPLGQYLAYSFGGLALALVSFGCFKPVARAYLMKFVVDHTSVEGELRLGA